MTTKTSLEKLATGDIITFQIKNIFAQHVANLGLNISPDRLLMQIIDEAGKLTIRQMLAIATQEEECADYPADWWQAVKERFLPAWLKRKLPIRMKRIWAVRKFPEIAIPNEFVASEFIHFNIIDEKKLTK